MTDSGQYPNANGTPYGGRSTPPAGQPGYGQQPPYLQQPSGPYPPIHQAPALNRPYYRCSFTQAVSRFFQHYVTFKGRASRSEFWWPLLGYVVVGLVLDALNGRTSHDISWLISLWDLAVVLPFIAVTIRRLHDANLSGWWATLPIGLSLAGAAFAVASAIQFGVHVGSPSNLNRMNFSMDRSTVIGIVIWAVLALACWMASLIVTIVLMTLRPDPRGSRFDDDATLPYIYGGYPVNAPGHRGNGPLPPTPTR